MEEVIQYVPNLYATFWALIPPLVAIILALITKEVYSSLFCRNCNRRTVLWKYIPERVQF